MMRSSRPGMAMADVDAAIPRTMEDIEAVMR